MKLGHHRNLQNQHGDARGSDGKKRLPESFDQIDVIAHVNAPLTEMLLTVNRMRLPPRHRERTISLNVKQNLTFFVSPCGSGDAHHPTRRNHLTAYSCFGNRTRVTLGISDSDQLEDL